MKICQFFVEMKEAFSMFDQNNDGSVSAAEIANVMRCFGQNPTDEEVKEIVTEMDTNGT